MKLLEKLTNVIGPSGYEDEVKKIIKKEIKPFVDEAYEDKFGNLIARKKGKGEKVMLTAHLDEIGLMVKNITKEGHIQISTIGGLEPITLVGQTVQLLNKKNKPACEGVITFVDLQEDREITELPPIDDLYVDTGLKKKDILKLGIDVGGYVIAKHHFRTLGNKNIICGKALDDRVGCYILIQLIKKLKNVKQNLFYVFTVQEEIGLYGAKTSVFQIGPDWGIAIDTTNTDDSTEPVTGAVMGKGPVIIMKDSEIITNKCLNDCLFNLAKKHKIPLQAKVEELGTTDATRIMLSRKGIPSTAILVPVRNIHSTIGVAHMGDIRAAIDLMYRLLRNPPRVCL